MKTKLKNDKYKHARGGPSKLLELHCAKCNGYICKYQKDGPGLLKRLYIDRIQEIINPTTNLICKACGTLLGIPMLYEKENRLAIRLFPGTIQKSIAQ